jgi:HSF-type DNA-binding
MDQGNNNLNGSMDNNTGSQTGMGGAAMAAAQGPKVVQTAFIHKLYNMLEDKSIQHLISWSNTNESFVMSPSNEFSKVLAQYFKHTNISSFVRQLNMYGFHKVSDVFHSGSPDSTLWEFRHGNGNFKKGDLVGLREIKRRASRHALIHRDSFSGQGQAQKSMPSQPGTPAEPAQDSMEQRMANMEHGYYRMNQRMVTTDNNIAMLNLKCQTLTDGLARCHQVRSLKFKLQAVTDNQQWSQGLSSFVQSLAPPDSPLFVESRFRCSMLSRVTYFVQLRTYKKRLQDNSKSSVPSAILTTPS